MLEFLYIFFIVAADWLAARIILRLPFGLVAPGGVLLIAPIFTLRDEIHKRRGQRAVFVLIGVASLTSYAISVLTGNALLGKVTIASVIAFIVSESADTVIYQALIRYPFMARVLWSNFASAFLDSAVFVGLAFGWVWPLILGQYMLKVAIAYVTGLFLAWVDGEGFSHALTPVEGMDV